jgi:hypothetical protein
VTVKNYIAALSSLMMSVFVIPDLDALLKFFLGAMVVLISLAINLLFHWTKLREHIVNMVITQIWMELFKKEEFRKILLTDRKQKHGSRSK